MGKRNILFIAVLCISLLALFQNCSKSSLQSAQNLDADIIDITATPVQVQWGKTSQNPFIVRGDVGILKIVRRNDKVTGPIKVTLINGSAKAGIDFVDFSKSYYFDEKDLITLDLETFVPNPFLLEDRSFVLKVEFNLDKDARVIEQSVTIKSKYEPIKFKALKTTLFNACGLDLDDQVSCWGESSISVQRSLGNYLGHQPIKLILPDQQRIDFASLKVGMNIVCFNALNSQKLYCVNSGVENSGISNRVNLDTFELLLADSELINDAAADFAVTRDSVHYITNTQDVFVKMGDTTRQLNSDGVKYKRIYSYGYYGSIGVDIENNFRFPGSTTLVPEFFTQLDPDVIISSNLSYLFTNDRRAIFSGNLANENVRVTTLAEDFKANIQGEAPYYISQNNQWFGNFDLDQPATLNLDQMQVAENGLFRMNKGNFCFISSNFEYKCQSRKGDGATGFMAFSRASRFYDIVDMPSELFDTLSTSSFAFVMDAPELSVSEQCTVDEKDILTCNGIRIFGDIPVNRETVRVNIDRFQSGIASSLEESSYMRPIILAESKSGRKLGNGVQLSNEFTPHQSYKRRSLGN